MGEYLTQRYNQDHQQTLEDIARFRLLDDDFMSVVFDGNTEATELLLNIILDRDDLKVRQVVAQREFKNLEGHSVRFDIFAEDSMGRPFDVEIQRKDKGASPRRARYNSSLIDMKVLPKGKDYPDLPDSYVIFITESDFYGAGLPLYHIDRVVRELKEKFGDGSHVVYVNGQYKNDNEPIGRLMHDFRCTNAADMYYSVLADKVHHFKETEGGRAALCKMIEDRMIEQNVRLYAEACQDFGLKDLEEIIKKVQGKFSDLSEGRIREILVGKSA